MKVVINKCFGGFGLSKKALELYNKYKKSNEKYDFDIERDDPILVKVVEELGSEKASDSLAKLKVVEIPDDVEYEIDYYDGQESIHQKHESWG